MQEKHLFEYAVLRIVPRVEREEFINTGVILYCSSKRFLKVLFRVDVERLLVLSDEANVEIIEQRLFAFQQICTGSIEGGAIGRLPLASRFRWLTAARSTVLQTSPVHPGLCLNPEDTLQKLFEQLVL